MSSFLIKVDDSSAMIEMNAPFFTNYRNMSAKISESDEGLHVLLFKNEQRIEINSVFNESTTSDDFSFKFVYSDAGTESVVAALQYNFTSAAITVGAKFTFNDQVYEANGSVGTGRDLIAKAQIHTPFTNYQQMVASFSFKRTTNSFRVTLSKNQDKFEINGSLTTPTGRLSVLDSN